MTAPARIDRRQRRRLETIEEIVDVAVEVMTEHGVGGLSLGEVARRMGMRTPSLYVYFDSKNAVYDAAFARGWRSVYETTGAEHLDVEGLVRRVGELAGHDAGGDDGPGLEHLLERHVGTQQTEVPEADEHAARRLECVDCRRVGLR